MSNQNKGARRPNGGAARRGSGKSRRKIVAKYQYKDVDHRLLYEVVRFEPKGFAQRRRVNGRWVWKLGDVEPVLYRLPQVTWAVYQGDGPIYVVEGEKDVHTLEDQDLIATCNPGGAGKWRDSYSEVLSGADVVIVADNDNPGRNHAAKVAQALIDVQATVRTVRPVDGCKDASEHYDHGYGHEDFVPLDLKEPGGTAPIPTWDMLLARAQELAESDGRDNACLWLVCQLRDHRYAEKDAWQMVQRYQANVTGMKDQPFTGPEARAVFDKNFHTEPRDPWMPDTTSRPLTDYGNAERLVERHGKDLRYCHPWTSWLVWDGKRWRRDSDDEVTRRAKETTRELLRSAAAEPDEDKRKRLANHAIKSESDSRLRAMVRLAESEAQVVVRPEQLDAQPMSMVVENGELVLGENKILAHDRGSLMTKLAPVTYDPEARAPTWDAFLERVMPNEDDRWYLRRGAGYSLTGDVREHVLFVLYGSGANGKSVFLETIRAMLGDYAQQAPAELIAIKRPGSVPAEVARLQGARFVSASETEDGTRLAESLVKQLTGGDRITSRFMRENWFEFDPTFKIWLATNHKPIVTGTDDAIWRRIRLVPFEVTIPPKERDKTLARKLRSELPGILNWALAGCAEWLREGGLGESRNVLDATDEYRTESDVFGAFLEECCETGPRETVPVSVLYRTYETWATGGNYKPMTQTSFGRKMRDRGFETARFGKENVTSWVGVSVPGVAPSGKLRIVKGGKS